MPNNGSRTIVLTGDPKAIIYLEHHLRRMVLGDAEANRRLIAEHLEAIAKLDE